MSARRHSPAVYRRRRLLVLLLAVLVIGAVVWLFVAQPWSATGSDPEPAATTPAATESSAPAESEEPADDAGEKATDEDEAGAADAAEEEASGPVACDPKVISVEPMTDKREYGDADPKLTMTLGNNGDVDCTINVGTTQQVFTITSGDDVWWRSTDCQEEPSDMEVTLKAGQEVSSAEAVVWDRTRSNVDTCDNKNRPVAPGGGASYQLRVKLGDIESEFTRQFSLG